MSNTVSREDIEKNLDVSWKRLIDKDASLLENDLAERCIAHRFAVYLEGVFPGWDVDCEYNRDGNWVKEIPLSDDCRELLRKSERVSPDIIVHRRGDPGPNLLAIEIKKHGQAGEDCDLAKLRGYMSVFGYSYGLYICFRTKTKANFFVKRILLPERSQSGEEYESC